MKIERIGAGHRWRFVSENRLEIVRPRAWGFGEAY
jgi:hypothetical protein